MVFNTTLRQYSSNIVTIRFIDLENHDIPQRTDTLNHIKLYRVHLITSSLIFATYVHGKISHVYSGLEQIQ
jgi:hypothetical protein